MASCVFAIPSYGRADRQNCAIWLSRLGVPKSMIFVQTQTEDDYRAYTEKVGDIADVDYAPAENVSENKNNLLDRIGGGNVVLCSDNVRSLLRLDDGGRLVGVDQLNVLMELVERGYDKAEGYGAVMFGVYPAKNAFFMGKSISLDVWLLGCFMGLNDQAVKTARFNPLYPLKEDVELCARVITSGGRTVRFNDLAVNKTHRTRGGVYKQWNSPGDAVNKTCAENLILSYPEFLRAHRTRKNEIELVKKVKVVKL